MENWPKLQVPHNISKKVDFLIKNFRDETRPIFQLTRWKTAFSKSHFCLGGRESLQNRGWERLDTHTVWTYLIVKKCEFVLNQTTSSDKVFQKWNVGIFEAFKRGPEKEDKSPVKNSLELFVLKTAAAWQDCSWLWKHCTLCFEMPPRYELISTSLEKNCDIAYMVRLLSFFFWLCTPSFGLVSSTLRPSRFLFTATHNSPISHVNGVLPQIHNNPRPTSTVPFLKDFSNYPGHSLKDFIW